LVDIFRQVDTMSTMADKKPKRIRRRFTDDYKASAVRLVLDESPSVAAAARDLGLTESSLRNWVEQARADRTQGKTGLTTAEREELARLRKEMGVGHELRIAVQFSVEHDRRGDPTKQKSTERSVQHDAGIALGAQPQCARGVRLQNGRSDVLADGCRRRLRRGV
jgi:transposase